jgi:hypothetical protein
VPSLFGPDRYIPQARRCRFPTPAQLFERSSQRFIGRPHDLRATSEPVPAIARLGRVRPAPLLLRRDVTRRVILPDEGSRRGQTPMSPNGRRGNLWRKRSLKVLNPPVVVLIVPAPISLLQSLLGQYHRLSHSLIPLLLVVAKGPLHNLFDQACSVLFAKPYCQRPCRLADTRTGKAHALLKKSHKTLGCDRYPNRAFQSRYPGPFRHS